MQQNTILNKAREDNRTTLHIGIGLTALCVIVFAFHWNYLVNVFTGPYQLERHLLEQKTSRRYLQVDLPLIEIGSQRTGVEKFGVKLADFESARFMMTRFENKFLLIKVGTGYQGGPVRGEVTSMPDDLAAQLAGTLDFYPLMLDCETGYVAGTDLFMYLAAIAFPFSLLILVIGIRKNGDPARHKAISQFAEQGQPLLTVEQIETELSGLPHNKKDSSVYFSDSWVVLLEPSLRILKANDLIGYGVEKDKKGRESVALWIRGRMIVDTLFVDAEKVLAVVERLKEAFPDRYKDDAQGFKMQWRIRRTEIEADFDRARSAGVSSHCRALNWSRPI